MKQKRASGILMPVSSLPSKYGIGCFSKEAYKFVDQLRKAGQSYWQILPLGPTSYGDSPYQSFSTFAGNPYFIDLETLIEEGLLTRKECNAVDFGDNPQYIDYGKLYEGRFGLLRKAYERSNINENQAFHDFCWREGEWLNDYALFMAVKARFDGKSWAEWAEDIRLRWGFALDYYRRELYFEIEFYKFLQFKFDEQWRRLKAYANEKRIEIIGDIPIYVAFDSADTWANPELFQLDETNIPVAVAGCPPDAFSATGQLWGNPLYRWDYHRYMNYDWWMRRLGHCFEMYDVVRIDHFRGFDEYFSIPYGDLTAANGHWEKGPGMELFNTMKYCLGDKKIIAEDLGYITPTVRQLVTDSGFPNMKVIEFAFEEDDDLGLQEYLPHNYGQNCVVYTGTHDNDTVKGWLANLEPAIKKWVINYMNAAGVDENLLYKYVVRMAMASTADMCIIPIQDHMGLDGSARINFPSTLGTNWKWRLLKGQFDNATVKEILKLTKMFNRYVLSEEEIRDREILRKAKEEKKAKAQAAAMAKAESALKAEAE